MTIVKTGKYKLDGIKTINMKFDNSDGEMIDFDFKFNKDFTQAESTDDDGMTMVVNNIKMI